MKIWTYSEGILKSIVGSDGTDYEDMNLFRSYFEKYC